MKKILLFVTLVILLAVVGTKEKSLAPDTIREDVSIEQKQEVEKVEEIPAIDEKEPEALQEPKPENTPQEVTQPKPAEVVQVAPIKKEAVEPKTVVSANPLLSQINQIRLQVGKQPLLEDSRLSASAKIKAQDIIDRDYWSHDTPDGISFSVLILQYRPESIRVGENLARCFESQEEMVQGWVASPGHYENIIGDWKYWGGAMVSSTYCNVVANHFAL